RVGPHTKVLTVVKADAYGHGLRQIAALLMQAGTDVFGVANLDEARAIRSVGRGWPILMLGACLPDEIEPAVRDDVMPTLSSLDEAKQFSASGVKLGRTVRAHLKVDTGMGRLGIAAERALALWEEIRWLPNLTITGLFTHFSAAEDDEAFTRKQNGRFCELLKAILSAGAQLDFIHANNSAALLLEPDTLFNCVRPGLLVYGIAPPGKRKQPLALKKHLRPALAWKCRVSLVKEIPAGATLSYGHTFTAPRALRVATLTAGYADGYLRSGSGKARVLIGGKVCPVLGRITMDQMLADVSRVRGVRSGDEAVLIGAQGRKCINASDVADWCGTVPWEVLARIGPRVPRIYRGGHAA
ncbi:MAG: alanine racemase, partial [Verrucomicrobia bacterium]|nr:alanine racemase [Verrucomicrobiota bacterium]